MSRLFVTSLLAIITLFSSASVSAQEKSQYFDSDGVKIHFVEKGEGEPVVLIHGFAASAQMNWGLPGVINALASDHHVIALDNRGHGKSGKPHDVEKYGANMPEDVIRLLDHLKIKKAHIVGYSMGGFITTKLITTYPERVASAVIGAAGWNEHPEPRFALLDAIGDSLEAGTGIAPLMIALTPEGQPKPTKAMLKASNQMIMTMNDPLALSAAIRGMRGMAVTRQQLEENRVPATALVGAIDPLREGVDEMAGVMSNLELVLIDGADHMTAIRNPKLVQAIRSHLRKHAMDPVTVGATN